MTEASASVCLSLATALVFISRHFQFQTHICHHFSQNKAKLRVLNFGWPLKGRKNSSGRPKAGRAHLVEVTGWQGFISSILMTIKSAYKPSGPSGRPLYLVSVAWSD